RQQPILRLGSGVLFQSLAERQVLGLALRRQPARVRGQKGERCVRVLAVLGQVEVDAADEVPRRVEGFQEIGQGDACGAELLVERGVDGVPQVRRTSAFRYSAPAIGGTAPASSSSSSAGGGWIATRTPASARAQSAVT